MKESARYLLHILVFVALVLSIGTVGYLLLEEGIAASDAFYMSVTAITPTQFDEVHELSTPGRYFTVALVFSGFGAVVAFATQFARLIIQSELEGVGVITKKQMRRRINRMKSHYIVCGYGEIGGAICGELVQQQLPFVVITEDESSIATIGRESFALVKGNPTADSSLKEAGIEQAVGVIAILPDDADNLFISLAARELNPKILIIARGEDSGVEDRILRAGADIVVSPMKLGGQQIAALIKQQLSGEASKPSVLGVRGMQLSTYQHTREEPITIADVISQNDATGACGIERRDGTFDANLEPQTTLRKTETLVMFQRTDQGEPITHRTDERKTILLADDHRALRLLFSRKLAAAGHDVIQAATGDEALATAQTRHPNLIVLDVNMPLRDGYDVCATLRGNPRFDDVPIILYSGNDNEEFSRRGKESGADMCIRKTSRSSELLASIEKAFAEKREPQDEFDHAENHRPNKTFCISVALDNVDGDRELLNEVIDAMLEDTPRMMQRLDDAIGSSDYETMRREAHTLKSSLAIVGADDASRLASQLESMDDTNELQNVSGIHETFKNRISELLGTLSQITENAS